MTSGDARRIVRGVSTERGTSPEYPDVPPRYPSYYPLGHALGNSHREVDRMVGERSREDEALQGHRKPSLWKRLLGRG